MSKCSTRKTEKLKNTKIFKNFIRNVSAKKWKLTTKIHVSSRNGTVGRHIAWKFVSDLKTLIFFLDDGTKPTLAPNLKTRKQNIVSQFAPFSLV